jgi:uncharacterized membrane protein YqaE (UPF0057 family)
MGRTVAFSGHPRVIYVFSLFLFLFFSYPLFPTVSAVNFTPSFGTQTEKSISHTHRNSEPSGGSQQTVDKMSSKPPSSTSDVLLYFLALFVPPASVFLKRACGADFLINILLTILGWIPGVLHAWWIISKHERPALVVG